MDQCKSTLSKPRQQLLEEIQQLFFGTIENLLIENGEPNFSISSVIRQEIKLGPEAVPRPNPQGIDFALKAQVVDLFSHFDRLRDAVVTVEVRHGLPHRLIVQRPIVR
jgi:hypothetical protein